MVIAFGLVGTAVAQTDTATDGFNIVVNPVAVIDVAGTLASLTVSAPLDGGDEPVISVDDDHSYLQYTSIVADDTFYRTITVAPSSVPPGLTLLISAATPVGAGGEGNFGTPASPTLEFTTLSTTAQLLIDDIGSCYTGTGALDGAQLTIGLELLDITDLVAGTYPITLTYTLTEDI